MDIDINEIGRNGYKLLRNTKVLIDKDEKDLTVKERNEALQKVGNLMANLLANEANEEKDKVNFLMFLYTSVICFIDHTDLNRYIKITPKQ